MKIKLKLLLVSVLSIIITACGGGGGGDNSGSNESQEPVTQTIAIQNEDKLNIPGASTICLSINGDDVLLCEDIVDGLHSPIYYTINESKSAVGVNIISIFMNSSGNVIKVGNTLTTVNVTSKTDNITLNPPSVITDDGVNVYVNIDGVGKNTNAAFVVYSNGQTEDIFQNNISTIFTPSGDDTLFTGNVTVYQGPSIVEITFYNQADHENTAVTYEVSNSFESLILRGEILFDTSDPEFTLVDNASPELNEGEASVNVLYDPTPRTLVYVDATTHASAKYSMEICYDSIESATTCLTPITFTGSTYSFEEMFANLSITRIKVTLLKVSNGMYQIPLSTSKAPSYVSGNTIVFCTRDHSGTCSE